MDDGWTEEDDWEGTPFTPSVLAPAELQPLELVVCNVDDNSDTSGSDGKGGGKNGKAGGAVRELRSLWIGRRIVLCFARHLGCAFCHQQVKDLEGVTPQLSSAGIHVVVVSMGTKQQARVFRVSLFPFVPPFVLVVVPSPAFTCISSPVLGVNQWRGVPLPLCFLCAFSVPPPFSPPEYTHTHMHIFLS